MLFVSLHPLMKMLKKINIDWFIPALALAILMGKLWPEGGIATGPFSVRSLSGIGVSVIFLLYGLRLNFFTIIKSLWNWKLHVLIQLSSFIVFPLIALAFKVLMGNDGPIWQGIIFLSVMPSTVSSAAVLVSMANGNVPAALFNSSLASVLGIIFPPIFLSLLTGSSAAGFDAGVVFQKLALQILLPIVVGVLLNPVFGKTAIKYRSFTRYFDQTVILSIVYYSFANSFYINQFEGLSLTDIIGLILMLVMLFVLINLFIWKVSKRLHQPMPDTITALFCGSTKSLVHGSTMGRLIYAGNPSLGIIILPLLIYHSLQLMLSTLMVNKFNRSHDIS